MSKSKQGTPQSDSSNIVSIKDISNAAELGILKTSMLKMEKDNVALAQTIEFLHQKLEEKENEIAHLKNLVGAAVPTIAEASPTLIIEVLQITDEEIIAQKQLKRLRERADGDMTLEDLKKFDILVKNKRLAQGNPTTIDATSRRLPSDTKDLVRLASKKLGPNDV